MNELNNYINNNNIYYLKSDANVHIYISLIYYLIIAIIIWSITNDKSYIIPSDIAYNKIEEIIKIYYKFNEILISIIITCIIFLLLTFFFKNEYRNLLFYSMVYFIICIMSVMCFFISIILIIISQYYSRHFTMTNIFFIIFILIINIILFIYNMGYVYFFFDKRNSTFNDIKNDFNNIINSIKNKSSKINYKK